MSTGSLAQRYCANPRDREADRLRTQLDRERAARDGRAVAFERTFFEATTRDLLPPDELPEPSCAGVVTLPRERFTDAELERF